MLFKSCPSLVCQFKDKFKIVKTLRSLSGFSWDDQRKMVTAEPDVWDCYLKVCMLIYLSPLCLFCQQGHPKAHSFHKKSFPLSDEIASQ